MSGGETAAPTDAPGPFRECEECGAPLERGVRYPVSVRHQENEPVRLFSFCDDSCQAAWVGRRDG